MRLWKLASDALWQRLCQERELLCEPTRRDAEWFTDMEASYHWMARQMAKRLPVVRGHLPWWAWYRWEPARPKPDLRAREHHYWPAGTPAVRLELEVPDEEVLLSDFDAWHMVLNGSFAARSEAEWDQWYAQAEAAQSRERLEASWERIFELVARPGEPGWLGGDAERIQACFEVLRRCDVVAVTPFRSRPARWRSQEGAPTRPNP